MYIHEFVLMDVMSHADPVHKRVLQCSEKIKHTETSDDERGSLEKRMTKTQWT
jgi:hypothetical protein